MKLLKEELIRLLDAEGEEEHSLFDLAVKVKLGNGGHTVYLRGLIEFSNICKRTVTIAVSVRITATPAVIVSRGMKHWMPSGLPMKTGSGRLRFRAGSNPQIGLSERSTLS